MKMAASSLVVRYGSTADPVLDGVSLQITPGALSAVIGPNGSGKSTLMRSLLGTVALAGGSVTIDDRPLQTWSRRDIARQIGAVAQSETIAFPTSTRALVAMGRYPHLGPLAPEGDSDHRAVGRALDACDLSGLADRDVATLSGGELQRARIARALAVEPKILILDEPTASLDIGHEMEILELLRASADSGMAVLLITHGLDTIAQFADRITLLSRGRLAADGTPAQVMREDILRQVYGWPISVRPDPVNGAPRATPLRRSVG